MVKVAMFIPPWCFERREVSPSLYCMRLGGRGAGRSCSVAIQRLCRRVFLAVRHGASTLAGKCVRSPMGCGFVLAVQDITIVCPEESLLLCSSVCQLCRKKIPCWGMTRRLRRGWWGCRPEGGSTFFRSERKYQRKHAARRLREKGFYCPF